jgi:transcriptional regulator with XRE-family HTH domain|tara:strand:+ start:243 stop:449 length:207 start_codon:yes stop_codon:yes gene_type:complete
MSLTTRFGGAVREVRQSLEMSQEALAHEAGINRSHISQIELGVKSPGLSTVERIALALDCPVSLLLKD